MLRRARNTEPGAPLEGPCDRWLVKRELLAKRATGESRTHGTGRTLATERYADRSG
jgi:hypothetical protein